MKFFIGLDDTDNLESRGTGRLARDLADHLSSRFTIAGVTRHQLLEHPDVPCTKKNSCAAILLETGSLDSFSASGLFADIEDFVMSDFQPGSDPGICLAFNIPLSVVEFGRKVKEELVEQNTARQLAVNSGIFIKGLEGTQDGVIGALAAVGLAFSGNDGRYVMVGDVRELEGLHSIETVKKAGIAVVMTLDGNEILEGKVQCDKLRPSRRSHQPILFVEKRDDILIPLKTN